MASTAPRLQQVRPLAARASPWHPFPVPELPDVVVYIECLAKRVVGQPLEKLRLQSPFVLRSVDPPVAEVEGKRVVGLRRLGKRIVLELEEELFCVFHLMIAGRFRWGERDLAVPKKLGLLACDFPNGRLVFTEAGSKKRASLHLVRGEEGLKEHDRGGLEVLEATLEEFARALAEENHTLKRSLSDPRIFSGIGNAYSDEILLAAGLSPMALSQGLADEEVERLFEATRSTLREWTERLRAEVGDGFPKKVTAFRPEMGAHGKFGEPCPRCSSPIQRIVYASRETNYCATCQTGGKLLSDRALARLLKQDWPKTLEELEERKRSR